MTEIDVTLTDYLLCIESLIFWLLLYRIDNKGALRRAFLIFFAAFSFSSLVGGTVHSFFNEPSVMQAVFWKLTLLSIGVTAYGLAQGWAILLQIYSAKIKFFLILILIVFSTVILFEDRFYIAILFYLPATLLMLFGLIKVYLELKESRVFIGILGMILSLVAPLFQQLKISLHPRYFNHNSVYHSMLMITLVMVFIAAKHLCFQGLRKS